MVYAFGTQVIFSTKRITEVSLAQGVHGKGTPV